MNKIKISVIGSGLILLLAAAVMIAQPFSAGLNSSAHFMLGGILITLGIWIFKPFDLPYAVGGLFLALFALAIGGFMPESGLSSATVFSGFTHSAMWTLVPALFFGFALAKTGLGKRIAMGIIKVFKPSYPTLVLGWVIIGVVLSVLTPATTVRVAIVIPIAMQCCELCKLKKGSKGNSLIMLTAFSMALIPGAGWLTGVVWGPFIQGTAGLGPLVDFNSWFMVMFVPTLIAAALLVLGSLLILKPKEAIPPEAAGAIKNQKLGKMGAKEIITALILVVVFGFFVTASLHGISSAVLCLAAVFLFFVFGVLEPGDFNTGVNWDMIIFIAMALSLGGILNATGISVWLSGIIVPALEPIAGNPWIFMFVIMTIMFIIRFADVAIFLPTIAVIAPILPEIAQAYNISPLVWIAVFMFAGNAFFMNYQNVWAMMSKAMAGDRIWTNKHLGVYGLIYFAACLLSLLAAIPLWNSFGFFG
ncbi:MAG: SLC13 family permease [Oscillospiraceae bacterium]|nr:SLC13 family permease [Oscillospiraceae bacterium]